MKIRLLFFFCFIQLIPDSTFAQSNKNRDSRKFFVETMVKIANPVLRSLSVNELKKNMPVVVSSKQVVDRTQFTHLEAFGRTVSGISPWLELGPDATNEGKLREEYIRLTLKCIKNATDPNSADYMNFSNGGQPLVDAAFLAQGLLRAPTQLWGRLDEMTKKNVLDALKQTRKITPGYNNWLCLPGLLKLQS